MSNELDSRFTLYLPEIEAEMRAVLRAKDPHKIDRTAPATVDPFFGMMQYHMGWRDEELRSVNGNSGKRIRPLLCLLACEAAGGDWQQAVPAGAAIEILHNFSLVHDDIQDASPTRRGRATLWTLWGQAQAINTGDAMFALAHLALNRLADRGVAASTIVHAFRRFDETCLALTNGQYADMSFETQEVVNVDQYLAMITGKTAVLVALCCELGALVAQASPSIVDNYANFGLNIGLAFQIHDDILGIWGDEKVTGKSAATDIITRKKTLPVLFGLENHPALAALYRSESPPPDFVPLAVEYLEVCGARHFAEEKVRYYSDKALAYLEASSQIDAPGVAMRQLSDMLLHRDH